jgi:hypothetical protein
MKKSNAPGRVIQVEHVVIRRHIIALSRSATPLSPRRSTPGTDVAAELDCGYRAPGSDAQAGGKILFPRDAALTATIRKESR